MLQSFAHWCFASLENLDLASFYREAFILGYRGVEMVPPEFHAVARDAGLSIVNASGPGMTSGLNRLERHEQILNEITTALKVAKEQRIENLIIFSGNREGQPDAEGIANCALGIHKLLPLCEVLEMNLHFELFNTYNHVDYQADSTSYGIKLWEQVDHPRFKILYDAYHMERMGEDVLVDISTHAAAIGHIHCAAAPDRTAIMNSTTLDYSLVADVACQAGFEGYIGQEFAPAKDVTPQNALDLLGKSFALMA